jgi:hypothetical protein
MHLKAAGKLVGGEGALIWPRAASGLDEGDRTVHDSPRGGGGGEGCRGGVRKEKASGLLGWPAPQHLLP